MDGHQIAFQRCLNFQNDISVLKLKSEKKKIRVFWFLKFELMNLIYTELFVKRR